MAQLMRRWLMVVLAAAVPCALAADGVVPASMVQRILDHDPRLLVIDVRTAEEYAASHIAGARNFPHDRIEAQASALPANKDAEIVVYCRSGRRSALAQASLQKLGYTRVVHLEGDYIGWQAANRPVEPASPPATMPATPAPAMKPPKP